MITRPPKVLVLDRPEQIEIVAHPLRLEIIERLQIDGSDSIASLARKLDRRANALTYHVRLLEKAGVLVRASTRKAGRRDEVVYALAGSRIAIKAKKRTKPFLQAATRTASAVLRMAEREIRRAIASGEAATPEHGSRPLGRRQKTWLTPADLAHAHERIQSLERFLERCHRKKRGRPYALTVVLVPLGLERKT
jgi:DNA-binding transcriptional ArsR family regulator